MRHSASSSLHTKHTCMDDIGQGAIWDSDSSPTKVNRKSVLGLEDLIKVFNFVHFDLESHLSECILIQANITLRHFVKN